MSRPIFETILAVSAGVALSTSLGYLAYAAPGDAVSMLDWLTSPLTFSTFLWAALGAIFGLSALQFRRGRRSVSRIARPVTRKGDDGQKPATCVRQRPEPRRMNPLERDVL